MKQKITFYCLLFSILINLYLVSDYGKRLQYTQNKTTLLNTKVDRLKDSIQVLNKRLIAVPQATE
ncbi:MAG: hypothetical protein P8H25_03510 [Flavobacteriaceae bacterium]|nr:hypothetical protein [Flavobacteriaceae bacterium]